MGLLERLCAERGLKVPRIGVIPSGTPNAFSFGHTPGDSRVVVTQGLLDVLTVDEADSVLAHEIGHIEHWDFVVMTIAALVPLLLYQIYAFSRNISNFRALAYGAYVCYWVSQFVVLLLNRTREYFADHYAAEGSRIRRRRCLRLSSRLPTAWSRRMASTKRRCIAKPPTLKCTANTVLRARWRSWESRTFIPEPRSL